MSRDRWFILLWVLGVERSWTDVYEVHAKMRTFEQSWTRRPQRKIF